MCKNARYVTDALQQLQQEANNRGLHLSELTCIAKPSPGDWYIAVEIKGEIERKRAYWFEQDFDDGIALARKWIATVPTPPTDDDIDRTLGIGRYWPRQQQAAE